MKEWYQVGKIVNTHGIRGEVRVISQTDFADERYQKGSRLAIADSPNAPMTEVTVASHRRHKNFDLLTFEGYPTINEVQGFKGQYLFVSEDLLRELEENEYYYHEIIGCVVETEEGKVLGKIKEILSTGANDVWVIQRPKKKDLLIPYIEDVVKDVDLETKKVIIHVMEGLIDDEN
ncbi:ribosome maturation factor RimM [Pullulanibacillus sp. KACC 23026]|uniref:ribosome maturation factor RimM n=1 Tax=Pullulanibacillus sp. KACC 23026 TaxID=3028315 RepID=UPI0023B129D5|nr:ribosome maturation factor RimM [Pullulanibacillus sp. KACC 23026]WEG11607.1 ribosome maturation factor RimM [Pullulanibacillus sp. KACC 23026]